MQVEAMSDVWLKGAIGVYPKRSHGELWSAHAFLSDEGIEQVKNRALERSFDGFYMRNQGGKTSALFFKTENMKSHSTLLGMEQIPSPSIKKYNSNDVLSYIMPNKEEQERVAAEAKAAMLKKEEEERVAAEAKAAMLKKEEEERVAAEAMAAMLKKEEEERVAAEAKAAMLKKEEEERVADSAFATLSVKAIDFAKSNELDLNFHETFDLAFSVSEDYLNKTLKKMWSDGGLPSGFVWEERSKKKRS